MLPIIANDEAIESAACLLRQGMLVAFPTETVYGLGADASNPEAVNGIFKAKGRPADHPLIVHIPELRHLDSWALVVPDDAMRLATEFWPGPLTLVLKKLPQVPLAVTGGQDTVALRIPNHPVALKLLRVFGGGVAAPSANRYCKISPTQAVHVMEELGETVDLILDGGPCQVGLESTIVDFSGAKPVLLRPGRIGRQQIEDVLRYGLLAQSEPGIRAPGMMEVHYAPSTAAMLCSFDRLNDTLRIRISEHKNIGLLAFHTKISSTDSVRVMAMPQQAHDYAQALYAALRELDRMNLDIILVEQPPQTDEWLAVNDRLVKATSSRSLS